MKKREEEIKDARDKLCEFKAYPFIRGFIAGAQWADSHPKNPWRDAKKEQPKDDDPVFLSFQGIECVGEYANDQKLWYAHGGGLVEPEYWMPIPPLPKED